MKINRILAATDFSDDSKYALRWAASLARAFDAELILQHVVSSREAEALVAEPGHPWETIIQEAGSKAQSLLKEAVSGGELKDLRTRKILSMGKPHEEIVKAAREVEADLIVMGTHGRHGLSHLLLGSVAERVVRTAPAPVFTVRHPEKAL